VPLQLSIRTFLNEIRKAGSYDGGIERLCRLFARRSNVQDTRYFYRSFLKRDPETAAVATRPFGSLADELRAVTLSPEFKRNFGVLVPDEFPHLQRDLFIHIPKTGGTSVYLTAEQDPRFVVLRSPFPDHTEIADWKEYYCEAANRLFSPARFLFIKLHLTAHDVFNFRLLRPQDRIYTIVRNPVFLMVSAINYILTSLAISVGQPNPPVSVLDIRRALGFEVDQDVGTDIDEPLILNVLDGCLWENPMCNFLGAADADTAYDNIRKLGIQVYDITALEDFFRERNWKPVRENKSREFVTIDCLSTRILHQIHAMTYEDLKLYERLNTDGVIGE
jgi:hypothetical protein